MQSFDLESSLESLSLQPFLQSLHKEQWQEVRLGEVAEIVNGYAFKSKEFLNIQQRDSLPIIKIKNVANGDVNLNDVVFYPYSKQLEKFLIKYGDILVSLTGNHPQAQSQVVGQISKYKYKQFALLNQRVAKIATKDAEQDFLYYLLKTDKIHNVLASHSSGSANQANISSKDIENLTIPLPPLTIQQKIAEILSSFDDKIDLLHRQNKTLESLALTLFRHYFIDNPKRDEWEEVSLDDICLKIASGGTPSTTIKEYYCGNINWYSTKEFNDNFLFNSVQTITENGLANSSAKLFPKDTIVIAIYAAPTVGRLGILTQDSAFNQAACGLIVDETQCSKEFIFLFLKNERKNLNLLASGSAQQNLNVEKIKSYTLALPDKNSLHCFNIQAKGFFDKIYNNTKQIQNLQAMRDMLLKAIFA